MSTSECPGDTTRLRAVAWHDPSALMAAARGKSGLELLQAIAVHDVPHPPFAELTRIQAVDVAPGRVTFACTLDESMYNANGTVHGGLICALLDSVCSCALLSALPAGKSMASIQLNVQYLRAVRLSAGSLSGTGTLTSLGSRVGFTAGTVTDADGRLVATGSSTLVTVDG